jgi:hypothetical protein
MTRLRLLSLLSVLALLAAAASSAGSASALEPCVKESTEHFALCIEEPGQSPPTLLLVTTNVPFTTVKEAGTPSSLNDPDLGLDLVCETAKDEGTLEPSGASNGLKASKVKTTFEKCTDTDDPEECEVKEPITSRELTASLDLESSNTSDVTFDPTSGSTFASVTIKSKPEETCGSADSNARVTGHASCDESESKNIEVPETRELSNCSGDELDLAGDPGDDELSEETVLGSPYKEFKWTTILGK